MHDWKSRGIRVQTQNGVTRNQRLKQFHLPKPKTEEAKESPYYRGAELWLKIPPHIHQINSKHVVKLAVKKHWDKSVYNIPSQA